jgi:hypothetical protein
MYVEWWMALVFLAWWALSISHISSSIRRASFAEGVTVGANNAIKVLEDRGIIYVDEDDVITGIKSENN